MPPTSTEPAAEAPDRVYQHLRERIMSLAYKPRDRLRAQRIADELQVSRTPVREALGRLVQDGLVRKDEGWGFVVSELTVRDVFELYRVRHALEVEAGLEGLPRLDEARLARLQGFLDASRRHASEGRVPSFVTASRAFHRTIAETSGNRLLLQMLSGINDRIFGLARSVLGANPQRMQEVIEENEAILAALHARDAQRLADAMHRHLEQGHRFTVSALQDVLVV